jgi:L-methionine (R)-S-oxide reductase
MYEQNQAQQEWLESFIAQHDGIAGTVHVQRGEDLYLTAAHNIPPKVIAIVAHVLRGKGMAGYIKPGAKAVDAQAAIALPVLNSAGTVRAVVGIAWSDEAEIGAAQQQSLMEMAAALPQ